MERSEAEALDRADPLAGFPSRFVVADPALVYLDGNSLGRLPIATRDRLRALVEDEWGAGLVRSWRHWIDLPVAVGDRLGAAVLGAAAGQVLIADSVTVNLHKLATAAVDLAVAADPARRVIVTDAANFPTDLYVLAEVARRAGGALRVVPSDPVDGTDSERVTAALGSDVALLSLSHVAYASGAMADLPSVTAAAHRAGALVAWDLSHSAGAVPVDVDADEVDLAVGCTYKHLFAGPGAPAFLYVARRLQARLHSPIPGWFGQRDQFAMASAYEPIDGVGRFGAGTPSILGVAAVDEGVGLVAEAGLARVREKGMALTSLVVDLAGEWLAPLGFSVSSPRAAERRGNHVSLAHPDAHQIGAALIAEAGVVPDVRPPNRLRLGPSPLAGRFVEVWDGLARVRDLVATGRHRAYDPVPGRVT